MPHCFCLIPDVRGKCILMIPAGGGTWTLPAVEHDDEWFAYASTAVARGATELYGIPMMALREHTVADCRVCELEIQAPQWTAPAGTRWVASDDLAATALEPAILSSLLREWLLEQKSDAIPIVRPPWERRGWYAEAARWILSECSRLGYAPSRPVEQLKAAWSSSSILRINTSAGDLYFKAVYPKQPSEPAVIEALSKRWPRNVPAVVAVLRATTPGPTSLAARQPADLHQHMTVGQRWTLSGR
jgi:hypothetical protein